MRFLCLLCLLFFVASCTSTNSTEKNDSNSHTSIKQSPINLHLTGILNDSVLQSRFEDTYTIKAYPNTDHTKHSNGLLSVQSWTLFAKDSTVTPNYFNLYFQHYQDFQSAQQNFNLDVKSNEHDPVHEYELVVDKTIILADFPGATPKAICDSLWDVFISDTISAGSFMERHPN